MNVSIVLKLLDGVTAPLRAVTNAVYKANEAIEHTKEKADKAFEHAEHIKLAGEGIKEFAEQSRELVEHLVQPFEQLEQAMARVKATTGANKEQFEELETLARSIGSTGRASAVEAASGMERLHAAGLNVEETMTVMPAMLDRATVSNVSLAEAINGSTDAAKTFGLKMTSEVLTHVNDLTATMALASGTSFAKMSEALMGVGGGATAAGVSMERASELIGIFAKRGIEGGEAAGSLDLIFRRLADDEVAKKLKGVGIATADATGAMKDPLEILIALQDKMTKSGVGQKKQMDVLNELFPRQGARVRSLIETVTKTPEVLEDLSKALEEVGGKTKEMADEMNENGVQSTKEMNARIAELSTTIGQTMAPALEDLKKGIIEVATETATWMKDHPALTRGLGLAALAVAAVTTALAGMFGILSAMVAAKGMGLLIDAFGIKFPIALLKNLLPAVASGAASLGTLATSMWGVIAPALVAAAPVIAMGLAITGVTLALMQLIKLAKEWKDLDFGESWKGLKEAFGDGDVLKTMTFNPLSGLDFSKGGPNTLADGTIAGGQIAQSLGANAQSIGAQAAPKGQIEVLVSDDRVTVKPPKTNGGIELDVGSGVPMMSQ